MVARLTETRSGLPAYCHCLKPQSVNSLKVYLRPNQAGSGDPQPDNWRHITPWTTVHVYVSPTLNAADGMTYTVTLASYYCGYFDLISGAGKKTHEYLQMNGTSTNKKMGYKGGGTGTNNYYIQLTNGGYMDMPKSTWVPGAVMTANDMVSSIGINVNQPEYMNSAQDYVGFGAYINSGRTQLQPRLIFPYSTTEMNTLEKCNAWIKNLYDAGTPFEFVYPLKTPTNFTVPTQTVSLQTGANYIWADCGDVEVTYDLQEPSFEHFKRRIMFNHPNTTA